MFRLSALLELADDQFSGLRDRSATLTLEYRRDVERGAFDIPLNLDSLAQYLNERINLQEWKAIGLSAGMPKPDTEDASFEVGKLLETLQALGMRTISEVDDSLGKLQPQAKTLIEPLVKELESRGDRFKAVPIDVINATITFGEKDRLPKDFSWTDPYTNKIQDSVKALLDPKPKTINEHA